MTKRQYKYEVSTMGNRLEELHKRFKKKGFMPVEIQGLVKDFFVTICSGRYLTRTAVNREMEALGWGIEIIDTDTYNLANAIILFGYE